MDYSKRTDSAMHLLVCSARPGAGRRQVLEATRATNAVLRRIPGYLEHEIAVSMNDGGWVDVVHWADRDAALTAEALYRRHPGAKEVAGVIEQRWVLVLPIPSQAERVRQFGPVQIDRIDQTEPCERCCG